MLWTVGHTVFTLLFVAGTVMFFRLSAKIPDDPEESRKFRSPKESKSEKKAASQT